MNYRLLGKTGFKVSEIGLGTWQVGGTWGQPFDAALAERTLLAAIDAGVNFIDTADVYSGQQSERVVGKVVKARRDQLFIATKVGRRLNPHDAAGYNPQSIRRFVEEALQNTGLETLDLVQLHCPPTPVYAKADVFGELAKLKQEGKIRHFGASVEKVEEALQAIEHDGLATIQIIFNMFRQKPIEAFFPAAQKSNIGVIVRVPLASGLLTGKINRETQFDAKDHRLFNRQGEAFDKGETFSGVDFETGLAAVEELKQHFPAEPGLAASALRWCLMFDAVSSVIPGASRPEQAVRNIQASALPPLGAAQMAAVADIYERLIKPQVHPLW
ncbi:MAG: aldo/keto reductase [Proteobacteria bacterium]|nr:aldo/keto reductase [Pseudomonadota bacterium]